MESGEDSLLKQAIGGDREALKQLFERHTPAIRRAVGRRIPPPHRSILSADDVMQETYMDAFRAIGRFNPRGDGSFEAWLRTIAIRRLQDAVKLLDAEKRGGKCRRIEPAGSDDRLDKLWDWVHSTDSTPSKDARHKEAYARLRQAVKQLPKEYRVAIKMYYFRGCSIGRVATAVKKPTKGAAYMLLARAVDLLKTTLGTGSGFLSA